MGHEPTSRRSFLAGAAGLTGAALAARVIKPSEVALAESSNAGTPRGPSDPSSAGLWFDDLGSSTYIGPLQQYWGGTPVADFYENNVGNYYPTKARWNARFSDFQIRTGISMAPTFYDWISQTMLGNVPKRTGAVVSYDNNHRAVRIRSFTDAFLTEIKIPALDASSKQSAHFDVHFSSQTVTSSTPSAGTQPTSKQKAWLTSNFRLQIAGVDASRVSKIEPLTVTQQVLEGQPTLAFSNVVVYLAASTGKSWQDWIDNFITAGHADDERNGVITFLAGDQKTILGTLDLSNLGILSLDTEHPTGVGGGKMRLRAEMYCEHMSFNLGPPVT